MNIPENLTPRLQKVDALGIIAGSRSLPLEIASEARRQGMSRIVVVAIEGETDPGIGRLADQMAWVKVGQLGKLISFFKESGVQHCVMAGQIAPRNLFDLRPDSLKKEMSFPSCPTFTHAI